MTGGPVAAIVGRRDTLELIAPTKLRACCTDAPWRVLVYCPSNLFYRSETGPTRPRLTRPLTWLRGCDAAPAQREAPGADVFPAVTGFDGGVPLTGKCLEQRQLVAASRGDRQVHVFERPFQRELGCEVAAFHLVQLGVGDRRVQRPALDDVAELALIDSQVGGQLERLGYALDQDRHVGVDDQLHPAALSRLPQPDCLAADRRERRPDDVFRSRRPRGQDEQLTRVGGALTAGHRGVHEKARQGGTGRAGHG